MLLLFLLLLLLRRLLLRLLLLLLHPVWLVVPESQHQLPNRLCY